jgi:hypothetical protein
MGRMRIPKMSVVSALILALLAVCACTDQVGLADGDPGRNTNPQTPLVGAAPLPDSSNATVASANAVPLSAAAPTPLPDDASPRPLPRSSLQPSLPEIEAAASTAVAPRPVGVFSAVTVTLSEHAQRLAAADPRLTAAAVATAVEHELQAQQLLAPGSAAPPLAITVDDFASTLASNAMVLGYTFRNVLLIGEVTVPGLAVRPPFAVHARARLTTRAASGSAGSLGPLYTRFAQLVVADLRGVAPPAQDLPR